MERGVVVDVVVVVVVGAGVGEKYISDRWVYQTEKRKDHQ